MTSSHLPTRKYDSARLPRVNHSVSRSPIRRAISRHRMVELVGLRVVPHSGLGDAEIVYPRIVALGKVVLDCDRECVSLQRERGLEMAPLELEEALRVEAVREDLRQSAAASAISRARSLRSSHSSYRPAKNSQRASCERKYAMFASGGSSWSVRYACSMRSMASRVFPVLNSPYARSALALAAAPPVACLLEERDGPQKVLCRTLGVAIRARCISGFREKCREVLRILGEVGGSREPRSRLPACAERRGTLARLREGLAALSCGAHPHPAASESSSRAVT